MGVIPKVENKENMIFDSQVKAEANAPFDRSEAEGTEEAEQVIFEESQTQPEIDAKALLKELEELKSKNARLLEESKRQKLYKERAIEEKLRLENNKDELLKLKEAKLAELMEREMANNIAAAVAAEATKRGCENWDFLLQTGDSSLIQYDEETGQVTGVKDFFDLHQNNERYSLFFTKKQEVKPNTYTPSIPSVADINSDPLTYIKKAREEARKTGDYTRYNDLIKKLQKDGLIR